MSVTSQFSTNAEASSILTLEWFIRYIYVSNVQLLNNVIITKTKVLPPSGRHTKHLPTLAIVPFGLRALKDFLIIWLSNLLIMSLPDEGYSKNTLWY